MTDAATLRALIEEMEKAAHPSKEMSRRIAKAIGWHRVEPRFARNKNGYWISPEQFRGTYGDGWPTLLQDGTDKHPDAPPFTYSIDSAVTLVPEGWGRRVCAIAPGADVEVTLHNSRHLDVRAKVFASHRHEPVATCLAALKARLSLLEGGNLAGER